MKKEAHTADCGIIIGRFQVNELHEAHKELIQTVKDNHDRVIIFLGLSPLKNTRNNPLDFAPRQAMIKEAFPDVEVFYVDDCYSDDVWSKKLDAQIHKWLQPSQTALLYGSRDSFISHYKGHFKTVLLESQTYVSGTQIRNKIINKAATTPDFRAGMIYASGCRFPTAFPTVDIFVVDDNQPDNKYGTPVDPLKKKILLGRKPDEDKFRAIGGFVDPKLDNNLEAAAQRELSEETGGNMTVDCPQYIGSVKVDDWRYRREVDKIMTSVFKVRKLWGAPNPADDIAEVKWFDAQYVYDNYKYIVVPTHHPLIILLGKSEGIEFDNFGERKGVGVKETK